MNLKLKNFRNKNKILYIIIFTIFILTIITLFVINYRNKNKLKTEERINIWEFSNILEIDKEWKLLSFPEVTILSETDWEVISLNVTQWDIVEERDILMQIWTEDYNEETIDKLDRQIWWKYVEFYENMDKYNEFDSQYWQEISKLEQELIENDAALKIATDTNDIKTIQTSQNNIQDINKKLVNLKSQRDNIKSRMLNIENEIQSVNKESINLYYEFDKQTPRASIQWIIWDVYVQEGDEVKNWDKLCTIIDNRFTPEISVWLDFNEYVLTKDLTWVMIITENENRWNSYYEWEIYTRSPKINKEWEYTITVKILEEDVPDLILSDENTKITVVFTKDFPTIWIPENCFTELWINSWKLTLRDSDVITWKEIWIKNKWNNWINIDNFVLFWLEKEQEKDWINSCIEDWNNIIKNRDSDPILHEDESLIEWRRKYDNVEDLCREFIKVNPMYMSGHENAAIVSEIWWSGEKFEVLCKLDNN